MLPFALSLHADNRLDDNCCCMLALKLLPLPPTAHMPATEHDVSRVYGHMGAFLLYRYTAQSSNDSG